MSLRIGDVLAALEERAPSGTAEEWDNVGLLVGDPAWKTSGAVVSIDLTAASVAEARRRGYRLIVNHHPCIFPKQRGLSRLVAGNAAFEAARAGIAVIACHTNFDRCALEVVERLSGALGVIPRGRLVADAALVKLSVFVPESHREQVREALSAAGAGHVGDYDSCTFSTPGEGTFRGGDSTRPFLGRPGSLERAREQRIETVFPRGLEAPVLAALRRAHPYEEIAYDLYAVEQRPSPRGLVKGLGYGFWGEYLTPKAFPAVVRDVKRAFGVSGFLVTSDRIQPKGRIRRLAFSPGKGSSFVGAAAALGCDILVTGETGYHPALDGARKGLTTIELGHRQSEICFPETMASWLGTAGLKTRILSPSPQQRWL